MPNKYDFGTERWTGLKYFTVLLNYLVIFENRHEKLKKKFLKKFANQYLLLYQGQGTYRVIQLIF